MHKGASSCPRINSRIILMELAIKDHLVVPEEAIMLVVAAAVEAMEELHKVEEVEAIMLVEEGISNRIWEAVDLETKEVHKRKERPRYSPL